MEFATETITLFDFAVSCLGRVQLAREFKNDFAKHQLQLSILQVRLTRWGEVAGIGRTKEEGTKLPDKPTIDLGKSVLDLFEAIRDLFEAAEEKASEVESKTTLPKDSLADEPLDPETNMPNRLKRIHNSLLKWVDRRMTHINRAAVKTQWAFYKKDLFQKFVTDLADLMDQLEKLFPEDTRQQLGSLSKEECAEMSKINLETLKEYVDDCDPWFISAVDEKLQNGPAAGTNITQSHNVGQTTGIHNGDVNGVSNGNGNTTTNYWGRKK
ncbi:hypothetical protein SLS57_012534 [Botryosphaeria dothidea]